MSSDLGNLTMLNRLKLEEKRCPNCDAAHAPDSRECPNCGIIFQKVKSLVAGTSPDRQVIRPQPAAAGRPAAPTMSETILKLSIRAAIATLFLIGLYYLYISHIESRIQAGAFQAQLNDFCTREIGAPHAHPASQDEEPFRTGKVLVVFPRQEVTLVNTSNGAPYTMIQPAQIHPTWFMLSRKVRARDPAQVDTVIRIRNIIGKAGRYGPMMSKVFNTHKIVLDVFDWQDQSYIGTKVFDPGEGSAFMTDEDYDAMVAAVSDPTIAGYIQAMEVRE
jgi:hypothetical protein